MGSGAESQEHTGPRKTSCVLINDTFWAMAGSSPYVLLGTVKYPKNTSSQKGRTVKGCVPDKMKYVLNGDGRGGCGSSGGGEINFGCFQKGGGARAAALRMRGPLWGKKGKSAP